MAPHKGHILPATANWPWLKLSWSHSQFETRLRDDEMSLKRSYTHSSTLRKGLTKSCCWGPWSNFPRPRGRQAFYHWATPRPRPHVNSLSILLKKTPFPSNRCSLFLSPPQEKARQALSCLSQASSSFFNRVLHFCLRTATDLNPSAYASCVAGIRVVHHQAQPFTPIDSCEWHLWMEKGGDGLGLNGTGGRVLAGGILWWWTCSIFVYIKIRHSRSKRIVEEVTDDRANWFKALKLVH
jgi:hypothetical protein